MPLESQIVRGSGRAAHGPGQIVGPQLLQSHRRRAELRGQLLRQTKAHIRCFAVDDNRGCTLSDQQSRRGSAANQRVWSGIGPAVGEHDNQGAARPIVDFFPDDQCVCGEQTFGEWSLAAGVKTRKPAPGNVRRRRRRQQQLRFSLRGR